jgi:hypothetical protein
MNEHQIKKQTRIERLERAARLCREMAARTYANAREMADAIPFGQPIHVGHHSEKADRRYRERITNRFRKSFELEEKAKHYAQRAEAARSNSAISSDDPDAVQQLKEKLAKLEEFQTVSKALNRIVKRKAGTIDEKKAEITAQFPTLAQKTIDNLFEKDFAGRLGVPDYALTNNNANIKRIRERIKSLEARKNIKTKEIFKNGVRVVQNMEENRIQLFFPGKPGVEMRAKLKSNGFRWAPTNGCWQRQFTNSAVFAVGRILQ